MIDIGQTIYSHKHKDHMAYCPYLRALSDYYKAMSVTLHVLGLYPLVYGGLDYQASIVKLIPRTVCKLS